MPIIEPWTHDQIVKMLGYDPSLPYYGITPPPCPFCAARRVTRRLNAKVRNHRNKRT